MGIIEIIEHFVYNNYEKYRDELIFKVVGIIGREKWRIRIMKGQGTILDLMKRKVLYKS